MTKQEIDRILAEALVEEAISKGGEREAEREVEGNIFNNYGGENNYYFGCENRKPAPIVPEPTTPDSDPCMSCDYGTEYYSSLCVASDCPYNPSKNNEDTEDLTFVDEVALALTAPHIYMAKGLVWGVNIATLGLASRVAKWWGVDEVTEEVAKGAYPEIEDKGAIIDAEIIESELSDEEVKRQVLAWKERGEEREEEVNEYTKRFRELRGIAS